MVSPMWYNRAVKSHVGYTTIVGIFLLAVAIITMCSNPERISSKGISFIDTELAGASGHETFAWSKIGFKSNERMVDFPTKLRAWQSYEASEQEVTKVRESLGANVFIMRSYYRPDFHQPVFFLIVQAKESSAFHPPPVCYRAMGYHVDEFKDVIQITGVGEEDNPGEVAVRGTIPMKKLLISKTSGGKVTERRVVLSCYLRGGQFTSDYINLIRISAIAPLDGSYGAILDEMKGFAALAIPHLFEFREQEESQTLAGKLASSGVGGWGLMFVAFALPIALTIYPLLRKKPNIRSPNP